jgi:hypothetical protein
MSPIQTVTRASSAANSLISRPRMLCGPVCMVSFGLQAEFLGVDVGAFFDVAQGFEGEV